jgi:hypothetical protein
MATKDELTDAQRNYLRGLPLYPWAVWSRRVFLGAFAVGFAIAVIGQAGASLVAPGFLLLMLLALIDIALTRLVLRQLEQTLHIRSFIDRVRLTTAINRVLHRDVFLGSRTTK